MYLSTAVITCYHLLLHVLIKSTSVHKRTQIRLALRSHGVRWLRLNRASSIFGRRLSTTAPRAALGSPASCRPAVQCTTAVSAPATRQGVHESTCARAPPPRLFAKAGRSGAFLSVDCGAFARLMRSPYSNDHFLVSKASLTQACSQRSRRQRAPRLLRARAAAAARLARELTCGPRQGCDLRIHKPRLQQPPPRLGRLPTQSHDEHPDEEVQGSRALCVTPRPVERQRQALQLGQAAASQFRPAQAASQAHNSPNSWAQDELVRHEQHGSAHPVKHRRLVRGGEDGDGYPGRQVAHVVRKERRYVPAPPRHNRHQHRDRSR
eukprot:COSAG01_NODE_3560_length_5928_cov_6.668209_8_plen_322_part_00